MASKIYQDTGESRTSSQQELSRRFCYLFEVSGFRQQQENSKAISRIFEIINNCKTYMDRDSGKLYTGVRTTDRTGIVIKASDSMNIFRDIEVVTSDKDIPGIHSSTAVFLLEQEGHRPCYPALRLLRIGCNQWIKPLLDQHSTFEYLSSEKMLRYFLKTASAFNGKENIKQHGSCAQTQFKEQRSIYSDTVGSIACKSWPHCAMEWTTRARHYGTPTREIIQEVVNTACSVVPKSNAGIWDLEWRISFLRGEQILTWVLTNTQYYCFLFLKQMMKKCLTTNIQDVIGSFVVKSILFWEIEETDINIWREEDLLDRITTCLRSLKQCVQEKYLPHYFARDNNLFEDKLSIKDCERIVSTLSDMLEHVIYLCHVCVSTECIASNVICHHVPLLINRSEEGFTRWIVNDYFVNYPWCEWESEPHRFHLDSNFEILKTLSNDKIVNSTVMLETVKGFIATDNGILCHRKALETYHYTVKAVFISLTEQFLKLGAMSGYPTAKLHLSAFYAKNGHFEKSLQINNQLLNVIFFDVEKTELVRFRVGENLSVNDDILVGELTDVYPLICIHYGIEDWRCIHYVLAIECFDITGIRVLDRVAIHPFVYLAFLEFLAFYHFNLVEKMCSVLKLMEECVRLSPMTKTLSTACNIVGYCFYMIGYDMKALEYYKKSFEHRPSLQNPCLYHSLILIKRRHFYVPHWISSSYGAYVNDKISVSDELP